MQFRLEFRRMSKWKWQVNHCCLFILFVGNEIGGREGSERGSAGVPDQVRTLSQVGTSSHMTYAKQELTQGVPIWLKKFLLGPTVKLNRIRFSIKGVTFV